MKHLLDKNKKKVMETCYKDYEEPLITDQSVIGFLLFDIP